MERMVIITGLSGSGKTLAGNCLEDLGFFCVDNLPVQLIPQFFDLLQHSKPAIERAALVVDIREAGFLGEFPKTLRQLKTGAYIVVAPDADRVGVGEEPAHFDAVLARHERVEGVAQGDDLIHASVLKRRQGLFQVGYPVMNVCDDAEQHERWLVEAVYLGVVHTWRRR